MGGAVRNWITAGWAVRRSACKVAPLCLWVGGPSGFVVMFFVFFVLFFKENSQNVNVSRALNTYFKCPQYLWYVELLDWRTWEPKQVDAKHAGFCGWRWNPDWRLQSSPPRLTLGGFMSMDVLMSRNDSSCPSWVFGERRQPLKRLSLLPIRHVFRSTPKILQIQQLLFIF